MFPLWLKFQIFVALFYIIPRMEVGYKSDRQRQLSSEANEGASFAQALPKVWN